MELSDLSVELGILGVEQRHPGVVWPLTDQEEKKSDTPHAGDGSDEPPWPCRVGPDEIGRKRTDGEGHHRETQGSTVSPPTKTAPPARGRWSVLPGSLDANRDSHDSEDSGPETEQNPHVAHGPHPTTARAEPKGRQPLGVGRLVLLVGVLGLFV